MVTSIDDLLTTLDHETAAEPLFGAQDAARALYYCGRVIDRAVEDGIGRLAPPAWRDSARRLASACHDVAISFDQMPGRISDLVGVVGDSVGSLYRELSDTDRWIVAARLAPIARRCAKSIASSGPYAEVPELLSVADRSRELQRAAAAIPPDLVQVFGLHAPIPTPLPSTGLTPGRLITESVAALVAECRRRDRDQLSLRELVAVCHVASRLAKCVDGQTDRYDAGPAAAWRNARDTLAQFSDGIPLPPPGKPRSNALLSAMRVDAALRRAEFGGDVLGVGSAKPDVARIKRYLRQLGTSCSAELDRIGNSLWVAPGSKPISDERAGEWLRQETFHATPYDLVLVADALRRAARGVAPQVIAAVEISA